MRTVFAVITGLFGLFCFIHYTFRSFRLFFKSKLVVFGPLGWTRWGIVSPSIYTASYTTVILTNTSWQLEFFHVNIAIIVCLVELELVVGTSLNDPILRLCAMTSATASYYLGFLCIFSSIMTSFRRPLPFNMSSTSKGSPWRPAIYSIVEDFIANEMK